MRKSAYLDEIQRIGEVTLTDKKGAWEIGGLSCRRFSTDQYEFNLSVRFKANLDVLPKASQWFIYSNVYIRANENIDALKRRIKDSIGYTPEKHTLYAIWEHFIVLRDAYFEQDSFYKNQDVEQAKQFLDDLVKLAIERGKAGQEIPVTPSRFSNGRLVYEKFLELDEIERAEEAQKVINGHSFMEPITYGTRTGHLSEFNIKIETAIDEYKREQELKKKQQRNDNLLYKLDVDVPFRKLVALAIKAYQEIRSGDANYELSYMLFGYARNLDEYRDHKHDKFKELMATYGLDTYDTLQLVSLGQEYIQAGGMLPAVTPSYQREDGIFYYNDSVHNGFDISKIHRTGLKYVYVSGGGRWYKNRTNHFERVELIQNPSTVEDCIQNELATLNNIKFIPNAHKLSIEQAAMMMRKKDTYRFRARMRYEKFLQKEEVPERRAAFEMFRDALTILTLTEQLENLKGLSLVAAQSSYKKVIQEIEDLQAKHQFHFESKS